MPIIGIILGVVCLASGIGFWMNIPNQLDIGTIFSPRYDTLIRPAIDSGQINLVLLGISSIALIVSWALLLGIIGQWQPKTNLIIITIACGVGLLVTIISGGIIGGGIAGTGGSLIGMYGGILGVGGAFIIILQIQKYVTAHQETYRANFKTICLSAFGAILMGGVLVMGMSVIF